MSACAIVTSLLSVTEAMPSVRPAAAGGRPGSASAFSCGGAQVSGTDVEWPGIVPTNIAVSPKVSPPAPIQGGLVHPGRSGAAKSPRPRTLWRRTLSLRPDLALGLRLLRLRRLKQRLCHTDRIVAE